MDCAQVGVLEEVNQEGLGGLRKAGSRQAGVERRRGGPEEETGEAKRQGGTKGRVRGMRVRENWRQEATFAKQKKGERKGGSSATGRQFVNEENSQIAAVNATKGGNATSNQPLAMP